MIDHPYIRLEHANPDNNNWMVINWCLGNSCNFACSYCPPLLHNSSHSWPDLETIKSFIIKIREQHDDKNIYFEFTGGEVTVYKHFIEVCKFCTSLGIKVGLISNGSRSLRYWEQNKRYFDHVCLSFHPEFANPEHFINVIKCINKNVRVHVNIMMSPEKFDYCFKIANDIKDIGDASMALQPLIHNFGDTLYDYTPDQQAILDNQVELIMTHIQYTKENVFYRGTMNMVNADGTIQAQDPHGFIADKTNNWQGWKCNAGVEQLIIDYDGGIYRGWCKVGGSLGHINDSELRLPTNPVICNKTMCHCNFDIMCTKEK